MSLKGPGNSCKIFSLLSPYRLIAVLYPLLIDIGSYNDLVLSMMYVSVICTGKGFTACAFLQPLLRFTFFCERDICPIFST